MSVFITPLITEKIGARLWRLIEPLIFYSTKYHGYVLAPEGYETNFGSIPRIAWIIFPPVDDYDPATVIHDAGYNNALQTIMGNRIFTTKEVADNLFYEGLLAEGVNKKKIGKKRAGIMYRLVSKFGKPDGPIVNSSNINVTSSLIGYSCDSDCDISLC